MRTEGKTIETRYLQYIQKHATILGGFCVISSHYAIVWVFCGWLLVEAISIQNHHLLFHLLFHNYSPKGCHAIFSRDSVLWFIGGTLVIVVEYEIEWLH